MSIGGIFGDIADAFTQPAATAYQTQAAKSAMGVQKDVWRQDQANQQPYVQAGQQSLTSLMSGLNSGAYNTTYNPVNAQNLQNDPGYQFRMQQAQQALQRSAAAGGRLNSGAFMKGLDQYSQGLASQEYNNAWQRNLGDFQAQQGENQARFGRLSGVAGMGLNAGQSLGQQGRGYANSMSDLYGALGNAQSAGAMAFANNVRNIGNDFNFTGMGGGGGGGGGGMGNMGGMMGGFTGMGGPGGAQGASATSSFDSGGNYSLGDYNLQQPTMDMNIPVEYGG